MSIKYYSHYMVYVVLLLIFILQSFFYPNFILSEEHHYLEVASNMFYHHQWWLLEDSKGVYLSKPPLLFWILSGLWSFFGVHAWTIHFLLLSIFAGTLFLTQCLYRVLFKESSQAILAPVIVLGSFFFLTRGTAFCFDILVVLFFVLSALGIALALKHYYWRGFILYGVGVGLGILTKGPIILAFCLPFFVVATFFRREYGIRDSAWFFCFAMGVLVALILLLVWFIPLSHQLSIFRWRILLLRRGFGMGNTYGHAAFYFYIKAYSLLFLPWLLWPYGVRSLFFLCKKRYEPAVKIVFYSLLLSLIVLSIIPPKELRYAMSAVVLFALLYVRGLYQYKSKFVVRRDGARNLVFVLTIICFVIEIITLCLPSWVMSKISYSAITYHCVLVLETSLLIVGGVLILLPRKNVSFETMRLCGFVVLLVICTEIIPHEILSKNFSYQAFAHYLQTLEKQKIPIIYCRTYGGYQFGLITPTLPEVKYALTSQEAAPYSFVYFIENVKAQWPRHKHYLYRLIDASQDSAIFVKKVRVSNVIELSIKQQQCPES